MRLNSYGHRWDVQCSSHYILGIEHGPHWDPLALRLKYPTAAIIHHVVHGQLVYSSRLINGHWITL